MRPATLFLGSTFAVLVAVVVFGVAALLGEPVRRAAILSLDDAPPNEPLRLSDASPEAAAFFLERDSVEVIVPWDMTVSELLALYHLDNNASARKALEEQLGATEGTDPVRQGDAFSFVLTAREDLR